MPQDELFLTGRVYDELCMPSAESKDVENLNFLAVCDRSLQ